MPAGRGEVDADGLAGGVAGTQVGEVGHHFLRLLDSAAGFGGAGFGAALEPFDFAAHPAGERGLFATLVLEELLALFEELAVGTVHAEDAAGEGVVELDDAVGGVFEEVAVVGDDEEAETGLREIVFQPFDAVDVEVVGGLVEQEQVGLLDQAAGDGEAFAPAAGQGGGELVAVGEADGAGGDGDLGQLLAVGQVFAGDGVFQDALDGGGFGEGVFLGHVSHAQAALHDDFPGVGVLLAAEDLHEGAFASAVGADQT